MKAQSALIAAFTQRIPKLRDVITAFRKIPVSSHIHREAILRLIELYYREDVAGDTKFDISVPLAEELRHFEQRQVNATSGDTDIPETRARLLELDHMLRIAVHSPDMRWLHKPEVSGRETITIWCLQNANSLSNAKSLPFSPLVMLLKLISVLPSERLSSGIKEPIESFFLKEYNGLQDRTAVHPLNALLGSLRSGASDKTTTSDAWNPDESVFSFLEEVLARSIRKPAKYEDDRDRLVAQIGGSKPISHLLMTLAEQWPFVANRDSDAPSVAAWLGRFLYACQEVGEDPGVLSSLRADMCAAAKSKADSRSISVPNTIGITSAIASSAFRADDHPMELDGSDPKEVVKAIRIDSARFASTEEDPKHSGLHRWSSKDFSTALADGDLSALILCLSSKHPEVRVRAHSDLNGIWKRLHADSSAEASHPDAKLVGLLLTCLLNTIARSDSSVSSVQPTYLLTVYAALALRIILDPLHPLYKAVNDYHLSHGPVLSIDHIASYWTHKILYTQVVEFDPAAAKSASSMREEAAALESLAGKSEDPVLYADISDPMMFLLNYIFHSIRSPDDLEILQRRGTLEPLLGLQTMPSCSEAIDEALARILWRITHIEGGSEMLKSKRAILTHLDLTLKRKTLSAKAGKKIRTRENTLISEDGIKQLISRIKA